MARKSFNLLLYRPFRASFEARRMEAARPKAQGRGLIGFIRGKGDFARKALKENPAYFLTVGWLLGAGFVLMGLPSWRLYRFLHRRSHPPIVRKDRKPPYRKSALEQAPVFEQVDWSKTRAYSITYGGINVNLRGREPSGSVEPSEYEHVRQEIIKRALQIRDKEGRQVIEGAYRVEELYDNPSSISFPDIVLKFKDLKYRNRVNINLGLSSDVFTKWEDSGGHKSEGIFLAYGSGIKSGYKLNSAKIHDLVPTILHIFGLPIPRDVDGRVLKEIFQEGSEPANREVSYQEPEAADEKELLRERARERIRELKATRRI
jgi:hypothetical protein